MKLGLSYIFFMNENIDKVTKKQLLNYIESADSEQLKLLALDGDIHTNLTSEARKIINVRFSENFEVMQKINKAALMGINELVALKEWGLTPQQQKAEATKEKAEDWFEIKRRCSKYRTVDPAKERYCLAKQKRKHDAHWAKVFASIH